MHINSISLENFKRFDAAKIDLSSPITILVGPNSSGKSSIIKSILAMKQTASPSNENEVLAAQGEYVDLGVYKDYVYNHKIENKVKFSLNVTTKGLSTTQIIGDRETISYSVSVGRDHVTEQARLFELEVSDESGEESFFSITKKVTRDSFIMRLSESTAQDFAKKTLFPAQNPEKLIQYWTSGISVRVDDKYQITPEDGYKMTGGKDDLYRYYPVMVARSLVGAILRELDRNTFYIGPLRRSPSRSYGRTGHLLSVGTAGELTPSVLANLQARASKERSAKPLQRKRLTQLKAWVENIFPGRSIDAASLEDLVKLMVGRGAGLGEAISDVGFGISQVLPILVQIAVMPDDSTLIIEQPELHLHPSAQTKLSEIIASASRSGRRFIIETHSEHIVRGLQLAISNERAHKQSSLRLVHSDVKFLYIPAAPKNPMIMEVNEWGEFVEEWPKGFFDESYRLAMKLLQNKMLALSEQDNNKSDESKK